MQIIMHYLKMLSIKWCVVYYLLGLATLAVLADQVPPISITEKTLIDPELYNMAVNHARSLPSSEGQLLIQQLMEGNIDALYNIAQSLNQHDDRLTSVKLWHALSDGPAAHVLSAAALGFSYYEVDKEQALKYFVQASEGNGEDSGPHQQSLFNAGRLFLELNDPSSALAYIRSCAICWREYPKFCAGLTTTCKEAYITLTTQIISETTSPPGIQDAADMFLYSSLDDFPSTKEFKLYDKGMQQLQNYAEQEDKKKGVSHLLKAQKELTQLQNKAKDILSELQHYLLGIILTRIEVLLNTDAHDEL